VLVADDHGDLRSVLVHELRRNFRVTGAVANGRLLLDAAVACPPDVIVSDVNMPVLGGIGAMLAVRDSGLAVPFVMISADAENAGECLACGAAAFVSKGDLCEELVAAVQAVLGGRLYVSRGARAWHAGRHVSDATREQR
jgi:DNA-binding NarL/FixJ family response regulator